MQVIQKELLVLIYLCLGLIIFSHAVFILDFNGSWFVLMVLLDLLFVSYIRLISK